MVAQEKDAGCRFTISDSFREMLGKPTRREDARCRDLIAGYFAISTADRSASATNVSVPLVVPPVGSVGDPTTNRLS